MLARGHDPSLTNLGHFHAEANFEALRSGDFTTVKQLSKAIHGEVLKARWTAQREPVAVKKWQNKRVHKPHREFCERTLHQHGGREETEPEDPLTEIGIFNYLSRSDRSCPYVLKMLGSFQDATHTYLVTEFADGGDLFTVAAKVKLHESQTRRYVCQLLQAISFLHSSHVGHRDVSLENALLKDGTVKVMDFGMAVRCEVGLCPTPLTFFLFAYVFWVVNVLCTLKPRVHVICDLFAKLPRRLYDFLWGTFPREECGILQDRLF